MNRRNMSGKRENGAVKAVIKRLMISCITGFLGVVLAGTMPQQIQKIAQKRQEQTAVTAWWGTLYPKFCFSELPDENKGQKDDIKISFWLAQVLDW